MAFELRDYQVDLINRARESIMKHKRIIIQSPTGSGKTVVASEIIKNAQKNKVGVFFLVHQRELLEQTSAALWRCKIPHGLCVAGRVVSQHHVQLASIMTLKNRMDRYKEPSLIIVDECHRALSRTYSDIFSKWSKAFVIGLTATPQRTDGRGMGEEFNDIVKGVSVRYLIDTGSLCEYELFGTPPQFKIEDIKVRAGDYDKKDLEEKTSKPQIIGDAVSHYLKLARGKKTVVMCSTIKHAEQVAEQYNQAGIKAAALHGLADDRSGILDDFENGDLMVIASVQLLVEGVDIPSIACVQWLRPTKSLVIWMQGIGRGLRPHSQKDKLIILDHVGNWSRLGLPDDDRDWSLEGSKRKGKKSDSEENLSVQVCASCYFSFKSGVYACPHCGEAVEFKERKIEIVEGELERIQKAKEEEEIKKQARKEQGRSQSLEELIALGVKRQYRDPAAWAVRVFCSRQKRRPTMVDYKNAARIVRDATSE